MAFEKFLKAFGIQSFGELQDVSPENRAKMAEKRLHGDKAAEEARGDFSESRRILKLEGHTAAMKLRLPETTNLKYKDGTAWLNLVLALYDQDKNIIGEVLDLPADVRKVLAQEKALRDKMPPAKQKVFDAARFAIEEKAIFNVPKAADDNARPDEQRETA
jgi:hypothetical protein